jgi:serine/threonine-protein kinase
MGKVYRATNRNSRQQVAIKTLHKARQRDRRVVEKFLQEAEILARLDHPNIVKFHGVGRFPGGGYFIAMEYVDGTDLQTRLNQAALTVEKAVTIVCTVATAIAYSHSHGIVHGDLKPANVLIDRSQRVVVTDFGLAQFIAEPDEPAWIVGGTAGYTAPEVRIGGHLPRPAADIYSLGAVLVALTSGAPPTNSEFPNLAAIASPAFSQISAKCLALDPAHRFKTAQQLIEMLHDHFPSLFSSG